MINSIVLNYKIVSLIGEGGMGSVYLAEHQTLGRKVAIKVLLPELARNQQIRDRFINEAKTLSKLNHHNIVTLYDFSDAGGNLLLVMEYVEGIPLDTTIEKITGAIPEQRCLKIFKQILEGFAYAHKKGVVHRDIKPANIILQSDDIPKILDFGIAKIVESDVRLTKTGTRMGSVLYMSPEQVMGRDVDLRSDIYSLGVTLYEMLTGRLPYDSTSESEFDIQNKIVREPLPPMRTLNSNISERLESIILRATEKDVNHRFQNCEEFIQLLEISNYNPAKTVIQAPIQKTVYESAGAQVSVPKNSNKTLVYIFGAVTLLTILVLLYVFVFDKKDNIVEKKITESKNDTKSNSTNLNSNQQIDLTGIYEGTINNSRWELGITNFDGKSITGYNTSYWSGSKTVRASITGTYNAETGDIALFEESGKGSGKFTGKVYDNGRKLSGDWYRYSDNGHFSWSAERTDRKSQVTQNSSDGLYPEASSRKLNYDDVSRLSQGDLKIMRNEIFARHGLIFKTDEMRSYFNAQTWYSPKFDDVTNMLTALEKDNIELIKKYEK